ncbi:hypothetical protein BC629DRAFT_1071779 [Irpex lacteus]|nr:hypothetical protein BC629DRAFT_1071779 [Irpex lacteus]
MDTGDFKDNKEPPIEVYGGSVEGHSEGVDVTQTTSSTAEPVYRLYEQRFVGLFALVVLNFVSGFLLVWFGPIANDTAHEFGFTLGQVNWLGSAVISRSPCVGSSCVVCKRWGVRMTCYVGSALFVVSAWVRYAGDVSSHRPILLRNMVWSKESHDGHNDYRRSESLWFSYSTDYLPLANTVRTSILVLAIICTCAAPLALLMSEAPPTPPTHSASHERPSLMSLIRALAGRESKDKRSYMTVRERVDFFLLTLIGGVLVGVVTSYSLLTAEHFHPYGYSKSAAGLFGATLIIVGLVMAGVTAPLFDRVLTNHLSRTLKVACPLLGVLWLSMIWAGLETT